MCFRISSKTVTWSDQLKHRIQPVKKTRFDQLKTGSDQLKTRIRPIKKVRIQAFPNAGYGSELQENQIRVLELEWLTLTYPMVNPDLPQG